MRAIIVVGAESILHLLLEVNHLVAVHLVEGARAEDVSAGRSAVVAGSRLGRYYATLDAHINALSTHLLPEVSSLPRAGSQALPRATGLANI